MSRPKGSMNKKQEVSESHKFSKESSAIVEDNVPYGIVKQVEEPKTQKRRLSGPEDHMGENEPLCLNCGHRQDMHHVWDYFTDQVQMRDVFTGQHKLESVKRKEKVFNRERPCQHACLCTDYK